MAERIVVFGGIRSGKSAIAEALVGAGAVVYVATGAPSDPEMAARIAEHRARRPCQWSTIELDSAAGEDRLAELVGSALPGAAILVDALGGWVAGRMSAHRLWVGADAVAPLDRREQAAAASVSVDLAAFWDAAARHPGGPVVVVAEQAGDGVVPANPSTRRWLDLLGGCAQRLAADADRVLLAVAGRALELPPAQAGAGTAGAGRALELPPALVGATPAAAGAADLRAHGDTMVPAGALDFAVSVHGDRPPAHVRAALDEAVAEVARYPDDRPARAAAARRHGRPPEEALVCAGAAEAFWLLARVLRTRLAAVVHPGFTEPEAALRAAGVPVVHVHRRPEDGWLLPADAVPADADLVVLGNPTNPTGVLDPADRLAALCRPGRVVLVDEAFMDFVPDPAASLTPRRDLPGLVVTRSVTKLWGLAGVRAGYLVGPAGLVARCAAARQPWPVAGPALAALLACLGDERYRLAVCAEVAGARRRLAAALRGLPGVWTWDAAANFMLVRVPDGPGVVRSLHQRGVAVRPSTFPGLDRDHLRVTVRDDERNRLLVDALGAVLGARPAAAR